MTVVNSGLKYVISPLPNEKFNIVLMIPYTFHVENGDGGYLQHPRLKWDREIVIKNKEIDEAIRLCKELNAGFV